MYRVCEPGRVVFTAESHARAVLKRVARLEADVDACARTLAELLDNEPGVRGCMEDLRAGVRVVERACVFALPYVLWPELEEVVRVVRPEGWGRARVVPAGPPRGVGRRRPVWARGTRPDQEREPGLHGPIQQCTSGHGKLSGPPVPAIEEDYP